MKVPIKSHIGRELRTAGAQNVRSGTDGKFVFTDAEVVQAKKEAGQPKVYPKPYVAQPRWIPTRAHGSTVKTFGQNLEDYTPDSTYAKPDYRPSLLPTTFSGVFGKKKVV
jgi:hypothetical protein